MVTLLVAVCASLAQNPGGHIAFVRQDDANRRSVCVLDVTTGAVQSLSEGPWDGAPVWSPDGSQLAFDSEADDGTVRIRVVAADGSKRVDISHANSVNRTPAWSPDGKRLAYGSGVGESRHVRVYDVPTGDESVWGAPESSGDAQRKIAFLKPAWLTNEEIVAVGIRDDAEGRTADLYKLEQGDATPMVETRGLGIYVEWMPTPHAPTGQLAYESNDGGDREIFVFSSSPLRLNDVSNHRDADWNPVWSTGGAWLAFESFRGGSRGVYRVAPQGTAVTAVAADPSHDNWSPTWSPDGEWIAFVSTRTGKAMLHACWADGSGVRALTNHDSEDLAPAWRPVASK